MLYRLCYYMYVYMYIYTCIQTFFKVFDELEYPMSYKTYLLHSFLLFDRQGDVYHEKIVLHEWHWYAGSMKCSHRESRVFNSSAHHWGGVGVWIKSGTEEGSCNENAGGQKENGIKGDVRV